MARSDKKYYIGIRERYVKCVQDLMNAGVAESQTKLSDMLGIHAAQLNRLIRMVRMKEESTEAPTLDMIVELSNQFGYSCEWIMTGKGSMKIKESEKQRLNRLDGLMDQLEVLINKRK
jgi:plasmid maintenance system antidote protein VapI